MRHCCGKTCHATLPETIKTDKEAGKRPLSRGPRTALAIISHAPVSADTDTL